jgi:hypothetical protein
MPDSHLSDTVWPADVPFATSKPEVGRIYNSPEATFHHLGWAQRSMTPPVLIAKPKTP